MANFVRIRNTGKPGGWRRRRICDGEDSEAGFERRGWQFPVVGYRDSKAEIESRELGYRESQLRQTTVPAIPRSRSAPKHQLDRSYAEVLMASNQRGNEVELSREGGGPVRRPVGEPQSRSGATNRGLGRGTGEDGDFEEKRSSKLTQQEFLYLLALFNKVGIHFS